MTINTATASVAAPAEMTETQKRLFWANVKLAEFSMELQSDVAGVKPDDVLVATLRFPPALGVKFGRQVVEYFGDRIWVIGLTEKTYQNATFATLNFAIMQGQEWLLLWLYTKCRKRSFPAGNYGYQQLANRLNGQTAVIAQQLMMEKADFTPQPEAEQLSILS